MVTKEELRSDKKSASVILRDCEISMASSTTPITAETSDAT